MGGSDKKVKQREGTRAEALAVWKDALWKEMDGGKETERDWWMDKPVFVEALVSVLFDKEVTKWLTENPSCDQYVLR